MTGCAPELNDRMLADFLDMDSNITVNLHIRTIDQAKAIKSIKMKITDLDKMKIEEQKKAVRSGYEKITDLDKMKIEEQKKAVRSGYDMEIIPSDLATYGGEAKRLLQDLQTRNERMFLVTILIMNTAASRQTDGFHCPEIQLCAQAAGLPAGRRADVLTSDWPESDRD